MEERTLHGKSVIGFQRTFLENFPGKVKLSFPCSNDVGALTTEKWPNKSLKHFHHPHFWKMRMLIFRKRFSVLLPIDQLNLSIPAIYIDNIRIFPVQAQKTQRSFLPHKWSAATGNLNQQPMKPQPIHRQPHAQKGKNKKQLYPLYSINANWKLKKQSHVHPYK